jgi:hypothetical protein
MAEIQAAVSIRFELLDEVKALRSDASPEGSSANGDIGNRRSMASGQIDVLGRAVLPGELSSCVSV